MAGVFAASEAANLLRSSGRSAEHFLQLKVPRALAAISPVRAYQNWLDRQAAKNALILQQKSWGVTWPGHIDTRTCSVDTGAIGKAFMVWGNFRFVGGYGLGVIPIAGPLEDKLQTVAVTFLRSAKRFASSLVSDCKSIVRASDQALYTCLWSELPKIWTAIKAGYRSQLEQRKLRTTQLSQKSWGVEWPGHADRRTCAVDTREISKAFRVWNKLQFVHLESWANRGRVKQRVPVEQVVPQMPDDEVTKWARLHKLTFEALGKHRAPQHCVEHV